MSYPAKERLKYYVKKFAGYFCIYRLTGEPIFIFSTRRSGSTLLLRMIYSQKGTDYIDQPFDMWQYHPYKRMLPDPPLGKITLVDGDEEEELLGFVKKLLSGKTRFRHQWNFLDPDYSFFVTRLVFKILNGKSLADTFNRHFDGHPLYLLRHPVPTALSIIKLGWGNTAESFLLDDSFRTRYLEGEKTAFCREILKGGSPLEKYVLEWCLENLVPLRLYRQKDWLVLTYEELLSRPREWAELLCKQLNMNEPQKMADRVNKPTRTTMPESRHNIALQGPATRMSGWREQVSGEEKSRVDRILQAFGIDEYSARSIYPSASLCRFGPLETGR